MNELSLSSNRKTTIFFRKYWKLLLFIIILTIAFYFRFYHVDYPVVGYHNWKETHYLTEARNFAEGGIFEYGFFVPSFDYLDLEGDQNGAHSDSFPTTSILIGFLFMIFGESLFLARFAVILFGLGSIIFLYLFIKQISERESLALLSSLIFAITPLAIFFGRNVQLISTSLFFMLGAFYFYVKWIKTNKNNLMILTSIFTVLAIFTKYSFFLMIIPMLFIFPYKRLKEIKSNLKPYLYSFLILLLGPLWFIYSNFIIPSMLDQSGAVSSRIFNLSSIFTANFWNSMKPIIADNYTWIGGLFFIMGLFFMFILYLKKKSMFNKFMMGYILSVPVWLIFMADKLTGHSYHQYPLIPLYSIVVAFGFLVLSRLMSNIIKGFTNKETSKVAFLIVLFLLVFLLWNPSIEAKNRQFDTQFFGLDVAGNYLKENSDIKDKIFHSTHQSHGVLWHANRVGYNLPDNIERLHKGEELGANWLFIYQWGLSVRQNEELWGEIKSTYSLKQIAFRRNGEQFIPVYYLLEKGGSFDEEGLNELLQKQQPQTKIYELTLGEIELVYFNL